MKKYTLGFIFNDELNKVLLMRFHDSNKWKSNLFNGIGGKIENDESPITCIQREAKEETDSYLQHWELAGIYDGTNSKEPFKIYTYFIKIHESYIKSFSSEEGIVYWQELNNINNIINLMPNAKWMIPFCLSRLKNEIYGCFNVKYIND